jgi:hypothetical protein
MVLAAEKFVVSHCPHAFCNSCIGRYVAGKVADNVAVIGCPDPACETGFIEMDLCRDIIPPELFDRWSVVLCEELLGDDKFYCPFKDCSALLLMMIRRTSGKQSVPTVTGCSVLAAMCHGTMGSSARNLGSLGMTRRGRMI